MDRQSDKKTAETFAILAGIAVSFMIILLIASSDMVRSRFGDWPMLAIGVTGFIAEAGALYLRQRNLSLKSRGVKKFLYELTGFCSVIGGLAMIVVHQEYALFPHLTATALLFILTAVISLSLIFDVTSTNVQLLLIASMVMALFGGVVSATSDSPIEASGLLSVWLVINGATWFGLSSYVRAAAPMKQVEA